MDIDVSIRDLQDLPVDEALLAEAARRAVRLGEGELHSLSIAVVNDARIRALNRRFLDRDAPTDVIAFEAEREPDGPSEGAAGEVIVSADTARRQAREAGHSLQAELCLLVAHGALHALGYEDHDTQSRARMDELQSRVLEQMREDLARYE